MELHVGRLRLGTCRSLFQMLFQAVFVKPAPLLFIQRASLLETPGAAIMSTAMNFGSKSFQPRPPDKGSFPLDHFGERGRSGLPGRTGAAVGRLAGAARPGRHWRLLAVRAGPLRLGSARPGPVPAQGLPPRPEGGRRGGPGPSEPGRGRGVPASSLGPALR